MLQWTGASCPQLMVTIKGTVVQWPGLYINSVVVAARLSEGLQCMHACAYLVSGICLRVQENQVQIETVHDRDGHSCPSDLCPGKQARVTGENSTPADHFQLFFQGYYF